MSEKFTSAMCLLPDRPRSAYRDLTPRQPPPAMSLLRMKPTSRSAGCATGHGRLRHSPHLAGTSASEKAVARLCSATTRRRPTAAGQVASSDRQACNRNGHSRAGQSRCRDDLKQWPGRWPLPATSGHTPARGRHTNSMYYARGLY